MKVQTYSEYAALLYAARRTGRPVKWSATRLESFLADTHGRDGVLEGELALDADGRFLGLARAHLRRYRRLHDDLCRHHHDMEHQELPVERLCHSRPSTSTSRWCSPMPRRWALSRCRASRGALSDRAPDRRGGARHEHRSRGAAATEHDRAGRHALQDAQRPDLRQRRLRHDPRQGAGESRLDALFRRGARHRRARASCAASASAASWKSRAASSTRPSICASRTGRQGGACAPARRRWGRGTCRPSCRWWRRGLASTLALFGS